MRILQRRQESLPTELTQEEFNTKARELAELHEALALERETQKEQRTEMKRRVEELEQRRSALARTVRSRKEDRLIDIELHANDARGVVEFVRMDTGEVYGHRPMLAEERQLELMASSEGSPGSISSVTGTVTFTHPDTGQPVTMTLDELSKVSKRLQKAAQAARAQTKH